MSNRKEASNYQGLYGCGDLTQYRSRGPVNPYQKGSNPYDMGPYPYETEVNMKKDSKNNKKNKFAEPSAPAYDPYMQPYQPVYDPYQGGYYPQNPYYPQQPSAPMGYSDPYSNYQPQRDYCAEVYKEVKPVRKFIALLCLIFSAFVVACIALDYFKMLPFGFISVSGGNIGAVDSVFMLTKMFGLNIFPSAYFNTVQALLGSTAILDKISVILFPAGVVLCALFGVVLFLQSIFAVFGKKSSFVFCSVMLLLGAGAMIASVILSGAKTGISTGYLTYGVAGAAALLFILSFVVNRKNTY